jgi:hypothetical protein
MGIGVQAEVTDSYLALVRNMGSCPGDELQVIQPLHLFDLYPLKIPTERLVNVLSQNTPTVSEKPRARRIAFWDTRTAQCSVLVIIAEAVIRSCSAEWKRQHRKESGGGGGAGPPPV